MRTNKFFSVEKNSQGLMEFELEVPSGFSVDSYVTRDIGLQDRIILSLTAGTFIAVPYMALISLTELSTPAIMITGVSVLGIASMTAMLAIEYIYAEHNKAARYLQRKYIEAKDISVTSDSNDTIKLEVQDQRQESQANMKAYKFIDGLSITPEQFQEWAFQVIENGKSLALSRWTGKGNLFSRKQYDELMAKLSEANIVINRNGWQLTRPGRSAIMAYVNEAPSPTEKPRA